MTLETLKSLITLAAVLALCAISAAGTSIQDLVRIKGHERNVVTGLGIVIGLNGTGDSGRNALVAARPMAELLANLGNGVDTLEELARGDAFAIVQVTMVIPPTGAREGDLFDVHIEALFNAKSLAGGRLVPSMLRLPLPDSPELLPLAMATGAVTVQGANPRSGVVRRGGQVLEDHGFRTNPIAADGSVTLVLNDRYAGYPVASVIADAINDEFMPLGVPNVARVVDAKNIRVKIPTAEQPNPAGFLAAVMTVKIDPAILRTPARVVVNERVGSIVVTGNVEISPVAITHGGLSITTITPPLVPTPDEPMFETTRWTSLDTSLGDTRASARLADLLRGLRQLNVPVRDQIAILYQLRDAGALHGELVHE